MSKASERLEAKVTKLYMDMRLKRISKLNWMLETEEALEALRQLEHTDIAADLFYIHLLITKEAYSAVEELLEEASEWLRAHSQESPACHAYYLYLTTLVKDDAAYDGRVAAKLTELAQKNPGIWQIQWLLYYVDRNLLGQPLEQYHFLKRMFIKGCRSPLMYLEARVLLERNPTFLYEFSEFEVQLMVFMIRHAGMSERVSDILADYMLKRTDYRYLYLIILWGCHEVSPSKRMLEGICRMMVLGGCTGEKFTRWYRKGISEGVRVTGLFEAFMKSLPVEQWRLDGEELADSRRIPSEVIEYFAHASGMDDVRTAYLYAMVHKYRDNWPSTYRSYEPLFQPFMTDRLHKGEVNPGLAYLYENLLDAAQIPKERVEDFLHICYTYRVSGLPIEAGTLIVQYAHFTEEIRVPFTGGEVQAALYGEQYELAVENHSGSRMSAPNAVVMPVVNRGQWKAFFKEQEIAEILYHMAGVEEALQERTLQEEVSSLKRVLGSEHIEQAFKVEAAEYILPYWDINGMHEEIPFAAPFVFSEFGTYSKEKETAFWKAQYLRSRIGIYGMQFLLNHYEGTLTERGGIFTRADSIGLDTGAYAGALLKDMLHERQILPQHIEIFEAYCRTDADKSILKEFLEFEAEQCFTKEHRMDAKLLKKQAELTLEGMEFSVMAGLSFLYSLAEGSVGSLGEEESEAAKQYAEKLLKEDIYFSWMQPLAVICPALAAKEALQVLEYRGQASGPVWVRYTRYSDGKEEADSLKSDVMDMVCEGLYAKSFILFFGERLHYEIFGLEGTEHKLLKQGVLQRGQAMNTEADSRFGRINHMLSLREKHRMQDVYQELEDYYGQSALVDQLFILK